jgi:hypothetical protein
MCKKLILIISLVISGIAIHAQTAQAPANSVDSVTLVISGSGATKQDATHAALRNAIEQAYGVFVSAHTEILNDSLVRDEIITIASGNVYSYNELGASVLPNGNHEVMLQATLSAQKLVAYAQSKGASCELVGAADFAASYTANIQLIRLNQQNTIKAFENLKKQLLQIAIQSEIVGFRLNVGEPQVLDSYAEVLECALSIKTEAYWKQGALQFVELMSNTLNALRLTPEQIEQLNRYKMSSYPVRYNTLTRNPEGCEIAITTGQFYANLDLTEFLTSMMNSLLNPYYITDNLNNRYKGNVAYNRAHTTLFESAKLLSNDQLADGDLGLIEYNNHTITLPLDTLAKITNFEIVKYDPSQFDNVRIVIPNEAVQYKKPSNEYKEISRGWEYKNQFGNYSRVTAYFYFEKKYNDRFNKQWGYYDPVYIGDHNYITIYIKLSKRFYYSGVQLDLPLSYEILKSYYKKRGVNVSLKALSSTKTRIIIDKNTIEKFVKIDNAFRIYESEANVNGKIGYTIKLDPSMKITFFPEWNGALIEDL